ncbi:MAG: peptidase [Ignavibacteriae bacterium HGW-Ignavibacteriae-3]|nr:MAG: peptidase [Ignavibacteriae bacterium HGW-Ignavibacteriae-3]
MKLFFISFILLSLSSITAQEINFYGEAKEGGIIIGQGKNIVRAELNDTDLQVDKDGVFVFGFDRNSKGVYKLKVHFNNRKVETFEYNIEQREYEEQRLTLASKYVTPPKRVLEKINREAELMKAARAKVGKLKTALFMSGFSFPVDNVELSSVFGSQRILNGKPSNVHNGLDFRGAAGDTIRAIADGIVRIAGNNFYYNGNFILLDHGQGLTSAYLHMSKIIAKDNQNVRKGEVIGLVGSTGRATGPHLHLGVQWFKKRIDPMILFSIKLK